MAASTRRRRRRSLVVPRPRLVGRAGAQQRLLVERPPEKLEADGEARGEAAGQRERGQAGEVRGHGEDVLEVHLQRVARLLAEAKGRRRRRGRRDRVARLEGALEVAADERPHLLRAQVVRVVVAGGERERAEDDAALDLGPEARVACPPVHRAQVGVSAFATAVAHAVVAGEVARGLGGGDEVVGRRPRGEGAGGRRPRARRRRAASSASASSKRSIVSGSTPRARKPRGTPTRRPQTPLAERRGEVAHGTVDARRVERVAAEERPPRRGRRPRPCARAGPTWSSDEPKATRP